MSTSRYGATIAVRGTTGVLADLDADGGVHDEDDRHRNDDDHKRVDTSNHLNTPATTDIIRRRRVPRAFSSPTKL